MRNIAIAVALLGVLGATAAPAAAPAPPSKAVSIDLPGDAGFAFKPGTGVDAVQGACLTCHSSAYVSTQPALTRAQWTAEVTKMKNVYGAPIGDDKVAAIVDYLTANYGKGP